MIAKTNSFKYLKSKSGDENPSLEIILIHGFKSSKPNRVALERWLQQATRNHFRPPPRIGAFAFDTADVLSKGISEIEKTSDKLLDKIKYLEYQKSPLQKGKSQQEPSDKSKTEPKEKSNEQKNESQPESTRSKKFLFVAHGFGVWIIQNGLARFNNLDLSKCTLGIIFADFQTVPSASFNPVNYLKELYKKVLPELPSGPSTKVISELGDRLLVIGENWEKIGQNQHVLSYHVSQVKSGLDVSLQANTRFYILKRMFKKSTRISGGSPRTDELSEIFDTIGRLPSPSPGAKETLNLRPDTTTIQRPNPLSIKTYSKNDLNPRASMVSSVQDDQRLSKISRGGFATPMNDVLGKSIDLARSYLNRGDLVNANVMYQRCYDMMLEDSMKKTIPHFQIQMQMAITQLQMGKYKEAANKLSRIMKSLREEYPTNDVHKCKIESEIQWWYAMCLIRQGQYSGAQTELKQLLVLQEEMKIANLAHGMTEEQLVIETAKARRLLALSHAYLGHYTESFTEIDHISKSINSLIPDHSNTTEAPRPSKVVLLCSYNLKHIEAIIHFLWGNYSYALEKATSTLQSFEKEYGRKHFRSLEVASLVARLLAYNSRATEATSKCQDTLDVMTKNLGILHPLTLESVDVLVYIFRTQSRYTEAVDTSSSLCKKIRTVFDNDHPQTLRSKSQLAAANLSCGNYASSESILLEIIFASQDPFRPDHPNPNTLRFKSELAQAFCYSWKLKRAETLALEVLFEQRRIYKSEGPKPGRKTPQQENIDSAFSYLVESKGKNPLDDMLRRIVQDSTTSRVHPDLLFTMQVLAKIEARKLEPDLTLVQRVQDAVWTERKKILGVKHALSLTSEFELAGTLRDLGHLSKAQGMFQNVARARGTLLGAEHPDTLAAKHEALVMDFAVGNGVDMVELRRILKLREWQLGKSHPDTHQSLLWIFAIQLVEEDENVAQKTADKLLASLKQDVVKSQRLVESLQTAEKVAFFL